MNIERDHGLCVIHSVESATTLELTLTGLDKLLDPANLALLKGIRAQLAEYYSVGKTLERASERSQETARKCHAELDDLPPTERNDR